MTQSTWSLDLVEDIEVPGWLFIPKDMDDEQRNEWVSTVLDDLIGKEGWDGEPIAKDEALDVLTSGIAESDAADSIATFQVWPPLSGDIATCHIGLYPSAEMPDWIDSDAIVHRFDAPHIGPGIQCSTKREVVNDDGPNVPLAGVHFVFDDGESTLVVSVAEGYEPLTVYALRGAMALLATLRLVRSSDGKSFRSVEFDGVLEDSPWQFEESA